MLDIAIINGTIVDGTGNPWFKADIGVKDEKIVSIEYLIDTQADRMLDADGLVVAPGFFDIHSHSDYLILADPLAENKIFQGVTTDCSGHCGFSAAPIGKYCIQEWWLESVEERFSIAPVDKWRKVLKKNDIDLNWSTIGEYLQRVEEKGTAVNYCNFVGHLAIRAAILDDFNGKPTKEELEKMKSAVANAMKQGAFGFSIENRSHPKMADILYYPNEIMELCSVAKAYNGLFSNHISSYGDNLIEALKEGITIAEELNIPTTISHLNVSGKENWGKSARALRMIEESRKRGFNVVCDQMPRVFDGGGLMFNPSLDSLLSDWVREGGIELCVERLKNPETRKKIKEEMMKGEVVSEYVYPGRYPLHGSFWEDYVVIVSCKKNKMYEGKTIREIARTMEIDPYDAILDLLIEEKTKINYFIVTHSQEDFRNIMCHPLTMYGTDGGLVKAIKRPKIPNPVLINSFPRILGKYVRDEKIMGIEYAIRKMTSLPAQFLGLWDRGLIREGLYADITIFNPEEIRDIITLDRFPEPNEYAKGIEYVLVNGKIVLDKGRHTSSLPGKVIKRRTDTQSTKNL